MASTNTENPQDSTQQEKQITHLPQDIPIVYIWFGKTVP